MARDVVVNIWCDGLKLGAGGDFIARHDPRVEAATRTFALDGRAARSVDLCDPCNGGLTLDELRAVLKESGVAVEAAGKKGALPSSGPARTAANSQMGGVRQGRTPENGRKHLCIWCPLDYSGSGWLSHIQKKHGFHGVKDAVGTTCPVCGQGPFEMLSVHVSRIHDEFDSVTDAFHWAKDNGDPYGVYAARHAAGQNVVEAML